MTFHQVRVVKSVKSGRRISVEEQSPEEEHKVDRRGNLKYLKRVAVMVEMVEMVVKVVILVVVDEGQR